MSKPPPSRTRNAVWITPATLALTTLLLPAQALAAERSVGLSDDPIVTFSKDVAPILQENCERCHRPGGVGPMSLVTYEEVRPWAPVIKDRTHRGERMGQMPPYYVERDIGIQQYKDDERLTQEELARIAAWVDAGAPEGDPAELPQPRDWVDTDVWVLGEPDLIVRTGELFVGAGAPDWWGEGEPVPTGVTQDRYVSAVEIREVNDVDRGASGETVVGGLWIVHHMSWRTQVLGAEEEEGEATGWPVHELGRNPDVFDPRGGRLLRAGSSVLPTTFHLHSTGRDTRGHIEIGFHFHPEDYEPDYQRALLSLGDGMNIDIAGGEADQELHAYAILQEHTKITSFEPHLHAPGYRMCLEAIWGTFIETLSCAGYDHNWVKQYTFDDDHAPLLPKGTILRMVGYMDNTADNPNIPDPRNWQGSGNRSVTNMFIDLGQRVALSDEQFVREMAERRMRLNVTANDHVIGCPLCMANLPPFESAAPTADNP